MDLTPLIFATNAVVAERQEIAPATFGVSAFLTYAHSDPRFVDSVYDFLACAGIQTYLDKHFLEVGRVDHQIIATLKRVNFQIIFCTKAANASEWCQKEVGYCEEIGVKQIPILIDPIGQMDWFHFHLNKRFAIPVSGMDEEAAKLAIHWQLRRMLGLNFGPAL